MKPKDIRTADERADDFAKCLLWLICRNIKTKYNTLEDFKSTYCKIVNCNASKDEQVKFCRAFGIDSEIYRRILGQQKTGKYVTLDQISPLLPKWLHYRPHFTKHYPSGKSYSVHSYWYIDFDHLKTIFGNQTELAATIDAKSAKYTKRQFMLINKLFLLNKGKANKAKRLEKERLERKAEKEKTMRNYKKIDGHAESEWNELHKSGQLAFTYEQNSNDMKAESAKKPAEAHAPSFDNSDLDESEATIISVNTGEKVIDCAMELYGANDKIKAYVKQNKLIPIDNSMRFFYAGLNKQNNCYEIVDIQRNEVHHANSSDGRFEVGPAKNPYYFEKSNLKFMKSKMNDKYFYSNKFLSYIWGNYQDRFNKAVEILTESLGFTPRRDFKC